MVKKQLPIVALMVFYVVILSIAGMGEETNSQSSPLQIAAVQTGGEQVTVIANQSPEKITLEGYKLAAQGTDYQFEFQRDGYPVEIQPFGVLRIHSGSKAKPGYENQVDIFWTDQEVWGESKVAKLISPDREMVSTYNYGEKTALDRFAGCLTKQGVKLKTLPYCGACQDQKELLGESIKYIVNVNCREYADFCGKRHKYVPAWISDDKVFEGIKSLEELAEAFNCEFQGE